MILASSVGTVIEWYDFYLYGSLAAIITVQFFSGRERDHRLYLRPDGIRRRLCGQALWRHRLRAAGRPVGTQNTFLVTMLLMGLSTFVVGLLPPYAAIGIAAPIILVLMRLIQGLALAVNTAAQPPTSPSTRRTASAASTPPSSRSRRPPAWC